MNNADEVLQERFREVRSESPDYRRVDPALRETLARAIQIRRMRECGEVPAHCTATTVCKHY